MKTVQIQHIRNLIAAELEKENVELVDIELKGNVGNQLLRIYVDTPNGINLDRCAHLSRLVSDVLDINDPIKGKYVLEVSSPGLDRPLKTVRDFQRQIGQKVRIIYRYDEKSKTIEGTICSVETEFVRINHNGSEFQITFDSIIKAKIIW